MSDAENASPLLWHLKVSPYNEKVRWALDHKGVPHLRRAAMPGSHRSVARRLGTGDTFPVLVMDRERLYCELAQRPDEAAHTLSKQR